MLDKTSGVGFRQRLWDPQPCSFLSSIPYRRSADRGSFWKSKADELVKGLKMLFSVIPAKAGIKHYRRLQIPWTPAFAEGRLFIKLSRSASEEINRFDNHQRRRP